MQKNLIIGFFWGGVGSADRYLGQGQLTISKKKTITEKKTHERKNPFQNFAHLWKLDMIYFILVKWFKRMSPKFFVNILFILKIVWNAYNVLGGVAGSHPYLVQSPFFITTNFFYQYYLTIYCVLGIVFVYFCAPQGALYTVSRRFKWAVFSIDNIRV